VLFVAETPCLGPRLAFGGDEQHLHQATMVAAPSRARH
jgi:hypothetical protein